MAGTGSTGRRRGGAGRIAGTRGGIGRLVAMAIGLAVVLTLALADAARAGTYEVAQCGWGIGAELDPSVPGLEGAPVYLRPSYCTAPAGGRAPGLLFGIGIANNGEAAVARARWAAPPGTNITGARFTWAGRLLSGIWEVAGIDDGAEYLELTHFDQSSAARQVATSVPGPARAFEVRLECAYHGAQIGCDRSYISEMTLSDVTLTLDDPVPPQARVGGTLAAAGWHRGSVSLEVTSEDPIGSGIYRDEAFLDGAPVLSVPAACAVAIIEGQIRGTRLRPCPATAAGASQVDTTALADGAHALRGCAVDLGGGQGCAPPVAVYVDNSPPVVEFAAAPEGQVAATVSDAFSWPAAGTIAVRRADSESWTDLPTTFEHGNGGAGTLRVQLPQLGGGAYFFRATGTDAAGNSGSAQFRASGSASEVRRQLAGAGGGSGAAGRGGRKGAGTGSRATHLSAHLVSKGQGRGIGRADSALTVDFGAEVELRGRLADRHGAGVPGRPVSVALRREGGAAGAPERRRVVTDRAGRFSLRLEPGTSRHVSVSFHGGAGFAPDRGRPLTLRVRAGVSLAAVPSRLRTGQTVAFSGRVRPGAARIPARGKLVAIQYLDRDGGRWRPALVIRTGARGLFHADYRFRYITGAARIRLRATALPEAGWPYAPGSSPPITLRVRGD